MATSDRKNVEGRTTGRVTMSARALRHLISTNHATLGTCAILLGLAALYMGPRLIGLDRLVTTDEPFWLGRSMDFFRALMTGEFGRTYQSAHPGVLTMWTGALAYLLTIPGIIDSFSQFLDTDYAIHVVLRNRGIDELDILNAARIVKLCLQALFFLISMYYLRRLVGPLAATLAGVLIALDPFISGFDSLLHVDGLFAIASFAAIVALANAFSLGHTHIHPWIIAGVLTACAWLTRATGIAIVAACAMFMLLQGVQYVRRRSVREAFEPLVVSFVLWGVAAIIATVVLFPALWADPVHTFGEMWSWTSSAAAIGHESPTFFLGTIYTGDPGVLFYPVTMIWRLTPVTQLGLALFVIALARRVPQLYPYSRRALLLMTLFAILYVTGMTLGAKKFDRYILPVYPVLDTFAAVGYAIAVRSFVGFRPDIRRYALPAVCAFVLLGQGWSTYSVLPYRLNYFNPLLGGPTAAESKLQMGWGEGVDLAADLIIDEVNEHHPEPGTRDEPRATVRYSGAAGPLIYLLPPDIAVEPSGFTIERWYRTDYFVTTIQSWQRNLSPTTTHLKPYPALATFDVEGVEFVRVYEPQTLPPPPSLLEPTACTHDFLTTIRLQNLRVVDNTIRMYWLGLGETEISELRVEIDFIPREGGRNTPQLSSVSTTWEPTGPELVSYTGLPLPIRPPGTDINQYWLDIALIDTQTGEPVPASEPDAMLSEDSALMLPNCAARE